MSFKLKQILKIIVGLVLGGFILKYILILIFSSDNYIEKSTNIKYWIIWTIIYYNFIIIYNNKRNPKKLVFTYTLILLMAIILELLLQSLYFFDIVNKTTIDQRSKLSFYNDKVWSTKLFNEMNQSWGKSNYMPYIGWRKKEIHGKFLNIDSQGVRKTYQSPLITDNEDIDLLYMFGGSTMWGAGARDNHTIPSFISKYLQKDGYQFKVVNYGESAYTFFQEAIYLIYLLHEGHRPNYVIFYDGINELWTTYKTGVPGRHHQTEIIRSRIEQSTSTSAIEHISYAIKKTINSSMIYFTLNKISKKIDSLSTNRYNNIDNKYTKIQAYELTNKTVKRYKDTLNLLEELSEHYGFEFLCFWQPTLATEKTRSKEEEDMRLGDDLEKMYVIADSLLKNTDLKYFFNISDVFNQTMGGNYIDAGHLNEAGNEIVAGEIYRVFKDRLLLYY